MYVLMYINTCNGKAEKEDDKMKNLSFSLPFYLKGLQAIEVYNERIFGMPVKF